MSAPKVLGSPRIITTRTLSTPAANTAATVTLAADADYRRAVRVVFWSYSAAPTGGRLTISDGAVDQLDFDITEAGPGMMPLEMVFNNNSQIIVTLASGGGTVVGKLTVVHYKVRDAS